MAPSVENQRLRTLAWLVLLLLFVDELLCMAAFGVVGWALALVFSVVVNGVAQLWFVRAEMAAVA